LIDTNMSRSAHLDTFARDHLPPVAEQPEFLFDLPALRFPDRLNCAAALLDRWITAGEGSRPSVHSRKATWTYRDLQVRANQIAHVLVDDMGLVPGNRVLLRGGNSPELAACWLAVVKAGGIVVSSMPLLRARELTEIVTKAQISHALSDARLGDELVAARRLCPTLTQVQYYGDDSADSLDSRAAGKPEEFANVDTAIDDVCLIAFTSGSTGQPKATLHFHRDVMAACACWPPHILEANRDDVFIGSPPLAFTFGLGGLLLFPLSIGAATVLIEKVTPDSLLAAIDDFRATICVTAPTSYRAMAAGAKLRDLRSLRKCVSAGEALPAATRQLWKDATGIDLIDGIGTTELLHIFLSHRDSDVKPGATGKPVPGYAVCVLDDDLRPAPAGTVGMLAVKGPTGCRYLADQRQRDYVKDGWNITGDAYVVDEDGWFIYQARMDDMIVSSGYNIAGPEVESALQLHPAVAECGVIGVPDEQRGQIVKAFVVVRPDVQAGPALVDELQRFVKETIAPYKYPRAIEFREALPRTETGKLQRYRLRADALGTAAGVKG
jgi:2-aminobenzoate-CoA ligase